MIVSCELCGTKYRFDPTRIRKESAKVRCSRCGHVFVVKKPEEPEPAETETASSPPEQAETARPDAEETVPLERPAPRPLRPQPPPKRKGGVARALAVVLIPLILIAGGGYYLYSKGYFAKAQKEEKTPPKTQVEPTVPQISIEENIKAYFLENATVGQIFVVEGKVVNEESRPVSFVLLEGKLYTTDNQPALVQKAYCGNILSREDLMQKDMTEIQNIMMNREGQDLTNVHIPPLGKVPFMIVFHNLPELSLLSDYSVEVVSAQVDQ